MISVQFVRHTGILCNAPSLTSKPRDEYLFTEEGYTPIKRDCWFWWRDINDGIVRILGGGGARKGSRGKTQIPTIYRLQIKNGKLKPCHDDDMDELAWDLYNRYGHN